METEQQMAPLQPEGSVPEHVLCSSSLQNGAVQKMKVSLESALQITPPGTKLVCHPPPTAPRKPDCVKQELACSSLYLRIRRKRALPSCSAPKVIPSSTNLAVLDYPGTNKRVDGEIDFFF